MRRCSNASCTPGHACQPNAWKRRLVVASLCTLMLAVPAGVARAEETPVDYSSQKVAAPAVVQYLVEDSDVDVWQTVADYPQGVDIPFSLLGSLPEDLVRRPRLGYWLVIHPAEGLDYVEGSTRVYVRHADGSEEEVTDRLTVVGSSEEIYAGATNIRKALPKLIGSDQLHLAYDARINEVAKTGFERGNESYAHIEYMGVLFLPEANASVAAARIPLLGAGFGRLLLADAGNVLDTRADDLLHSTELKTTVYSYHLDVHKVDEKTQEPLEGASFKLKDEADQWYVSKDDWSHDESKATTYTTNKNGDLRIPYLDSEAYELVEVAAPQGYEAIDPVDVLITTDVEDGDASATILRASSTKATKVTADAAKGVVSLVVEDPATDNGEKPDDTNNPDDTDSPDDGNTPDEGNKQFPGDEPQDGTGNTGKNDDSSAQEGSQEAETSLSSLAKRFLPSLFGRTPKTGDATNQAWLVVAFLSVLALLSGLALRRGAGRMDIHRSSAHGSADKEERNNHGSR